MSDSMDDPTLRLLHLLAMLGAAEELASGASEAGSSSTTSKSAYHLSDYVLVAAIDFGTTFSGYAFSFKTNKNDIKMNKNWGAEIGCSSYKTPTCLLLNPNGKFEAFGYEAQNQYAAMVEEDDQKYYFFERFKMRLHNEKNLNTSTEIPATNGKTLPALKVFSISLNYLMTHLTKAIGEAIEGDVSKSMIRWVITVPAIWSDASKQFMREAAYKGGLIDSLDSKQLVIALEPEAASLHVRSLDINQFARNSGDEGLNMKVGTQYLVIDAGGGTVDITAHELQDEGKIKELHYATGGALGGTRVDESFVKLMGDIFGNDFINTFQKESASQWLQIISDFEKKKRLAKEDCKTNIPLTWDFGRKYSAMKGDIVQAIKKYKGGGVKFANGVMCIDAATTKGLFKPVVDGIVSHIENLLKTPKLKNVQYFFCVGGFSESQILQDAIKSNFAGKVRILVPEEASLAVVKGAVQFGHEPDSISSRVAAKTYGVETMSNFLPFIHSRDKAVNIDGTIYCKDIFEEFVQKGDEVPVGYCKTVQFTPVRDEQQGADVEIYSIDNPNVEYITDDGVEHHGNIHVKWPGSGKNRKLEIAMTFGGTEVQVAATSYPGGNTADTKINFMAE